MLSILWGPLAPPGLFFSKTFGIFTGFSLLGTQRHSPALGGSQPHVSAGGRAGGTGLVSRGVLCPRRSRGRRLQSPPASREFQSIPARPAQFMAKQLGCEVVTSEIRAALCYRGGCSSRLWVTSWSHKSNISCVHFVFRRHPRRKMLEERPPPPRTLKASRPTRGR